MLQLRPWNGKGSVVSDAVVGVLACLCLAGMVGWLWFMWEAFRAGVVWGLGCMFVPFVGLLFLLHKPERAGKPFLLHLGGMGPVVVWAAFTTPVEPVNPEPRPVKAALQPAVKKKATDKPRVRTVTTYR